MYYNFSKIYNYLNKQALHSQNKCEEAIKCYDEALAINPKFAEALNYKGVSLHNLKKCEEAVKCYDDALAINPGKFIQFNSFEIIKTKNKQYFIIFSAYSDCLNNKGVALLLLNRYQEALECHDKALAINPNSAHGIYNKANVLRHLNQQTAAPTS